MTIIHSTDQLRSWRSSVFDQTIALVPTMGALHRGHTALIELAAKRCDIVVVSIFVNKLQFTHQADFDLYPRTLQSDTNASIAAGATHIFAPSTAEMFPPGFASYITPTSLADDYEGMLRPGHFAGVVTVVHRLFELVRPDVAIFGAKDFQQVAVIRAMAAELHPTLVIYSAPTIRDPDGLALSSRNIRLSANARITARAIPETLFALRISFRSGQTNADLLKHEATQRLSKVSELNIEYLEIVHPSTLKPTANAHGSVVLIAGVVDGVRLIDNIALD